MKHPSAPFVELLGPRSGPISRQRDRCYDCGAEPGQRHRIKCDLSPTAEWIQEWLSKGRYTTNAVWGPELHEDSFPKYATDVASGRIAGEQVWP